jgi:hypothetical protein
VSDNGICPWPEFDSMTGWCSHCKTNVSLPMALWVAYQQQLQTSEAA